MKEVLVLRKMVFSLVAVAAVILVFVSVRAYAPTAEEGEADTPTGAAQKLTIQYKQIEGVNPNLLSLDIYTKPDMDSAPVLLFFHGGGLTKRTSMLQRPSLRTS